MINAGIFCPGWDAVKLKFQVVEQLADLKLKGYRKHIQFSKLPEKRSFDMEI